MRLRKSLPGLPPTQKSSSAAKIILRAPGKSFRGLILSAVIHFSNFYIHFRKSVLSFNRLYYIIRPIPRLLQFVYRRRPAEAAFIEGALRQKTEKER